MADDKARFTQAVKRWEALKRSRHRRSVPADIGKTAIIISRYSSNPCPAEAAAEMNAFEREGHHIAEKLEKCGRRAVIVESVGSAVAEIFKNRDVCSIYTIGHGSLSHLSSQDSANEVDWDFLSITADHLKTGVFEQRQCGNMSRALNVPLGLFTMLHPCAVRAAAGDFLPSSELTVSEEALIKQLFTDDKMPSYKTIRSRFPQDQPHLPVLVPRDIPVLTPVTILPF